MTATLSIIKVPEQSACFRQPKSWTLPGVHRALCDWSMRVKLAAYLYILLLYSEFSSYFPINIAQMNEDWCSCATTSIRLSLNWIQCCQVRNNFQIPINYLGGH